MKPQLFVFLGRSGCGKGTQVALLTEYLKKNDPQEGIFYVSTGDEFRKLISGEEYTSKKLKSVIDGGNFAPSYLAVMCWSIAMVKNYKEDMHMITDGSPRKIPEAIIFDTLYDFYGFEKPNFIYINVSKEWATDKLLKRAEVQGRLDDSRNGIEKRMGEFEKDLKPVIEFYKPRKDINFVEINGEQAIEKVHQEIIKSLSI